MREQSIDRRNFLATTSGVVAAAALPSSKLFAQPAGSCRC